jgi:hypothetical protein
MHHLALDHGELLKRLDAATRAHIMTFWRKENENKKPAEGNSNDVGVDVDIYPLARPNVIQLP